jgi:poly-beta-1,6-N-acetyl-D-glucosamine synthase
MTFILFLLPGILYSGFLAFLALGILRLPKPGMQNSYQKISIIVAARNEENNLEHLLQCLSSQDYPNENYEIIIVDDRSTDRTPVILDQYKQSLTNLKIATIYEENPNIIGKKNALDTGIKMAMHEVLAFTDADCSPGRNWLKEVDRHMTEEIDLLVGYSSLLIDAKPIPSALKNLERTIYAGIAAGSFGWKIGITCTATNMIYRKSLFNKVNGFTSIGHIRSGDDDLMMLKMMPYIRQLNYMMTKESFVPAKYSLTLDTHMALETRRASKWRYYPYYLKILTFLIFLFIIYFCTTFFMGLMNLLPWSVFLLLLLIKTLGEVILIAPFLIKIKRLSLLAAYPLFIIYYPFHFLFFAFKGTFGSYKWKDR